ncbi:hypothetical protein [Lentimicrobium sp. S6]|uniref:hypothetical protein n=1 Tax=Lentimicrobium sp. S6 TaxID=2735872 RepID=UPI0015527EF1|nr:hypothetical protein [Lentimicrobium sp. S6]NPD44256.1 hypothetical protein [Lentimicrobium sp. S6]
MDKCLGAGGSWNEDSKECIKCESDFMQLKNAEKYSVSAYYDIVNQTSSILDSVQIVPHGYKSENFIEIPAQSTRIFIADMSSTKRSDGHYHLSFLRGKGQMENIEFGYYTNGYLLEKKNKIIIEVDSIFIHPEHGDY